MKMNVNGAEEVPWVTIISWIITIVGWIVTIFAMFYPLKKKYKDLDENFEARVEYKIIEIKKQQAYGVNKSNYLSQISSMQNDIDSVIDELRQGVFGYNTLQRIKSIVAKMAQFGLMLRFQEEDIKFTSETQKYLNIFSEEGISKIENENTKSDLIIKLEKLKLIMTRGENVL